MSSLLDRIKRSLKAKLAYLLEISRIPRQVTEYRKRHIGKTVIHYGYKDKTQEIHIYCLERIYRVRYSGLIRYKEHLGVYEVYSILPGDNLDPEIVRLFDRKITLPGMLSIYLDDRLKARAAIMAYVTVLIDREERRKAANALDADKPDNQTPA